MRFIAIFLVLILTGCTGDIKSFHSDTYKIGVVLKTLEHEYWKEVRTGLNEKAKELNVELIVLGTYEEDDEIEQKNMIMHLLNLDLDAVIVSPVNSFDTVEFELRSHDRNIPIVAVDTKIINDEINYIGSDNINIGKLAAEYIYENYPDTPLNIGIIAGDSLQQVHNDRMSGFVDFIEENTSHEIKIIENSKATTEAAITVAKKTQDLAPDLDIIYCTSSTIALGTVEVFKTQGLSENTDIISVDTQFNIIENIRNGNIKASISQSGKQIGSTALQTTVDMLNGEEIPMEVFVKSEVIDINNAENYIDELS